MAPVHDAAWHNNVEALRNMLGAEPGLMEAVDYRWNRTRPLHFASFAGSMEAACLLLDRGASIDSRSGDGWTPLMKACQSGRVEVVAMLLARGADPTLVTSLARLTPLIMASEGRELEGSDHVAVIRLLIQDGRVPVNARIRNGKTALYWACYRDFTERARVLLLEGRVDHTIADEQGATPMAAARRGGSQACVQLLEWYEGELERGALLGKARAVVDATESISKAPEKVGAKTEAEAQRAREEAAPVYLRGRVERHEALPSVEVGGRRTRRSGQGEEGERRAVLEFVVTVLKEDLHIELMEGLYLR